ncbi:MAG: phosphoribosylamine--glycine ligase [Azospirillaceae bacterium]|nr:phosphoribosylamine--glycine ligase [Azospirillaceae bacterium]
MKLLVVGSGGREHALCWALAASPLCDKLWCAPGNAGIAGTAECVDIAADDLDRLVAFARDHAVDLVVVGPEAPLVAGLVDQLAVAGIRAFGPRAAAAALEGSKGFMKDLCARHRIPTAGYRRFTDPALAKAYVAQRTLPIVIKADGLAAGKGVTIAHDVAEAGAAIDEALVGGRFGRAGAELVIEDFLAGEEVSFFAIVDGTTALPLAAAQDHKAVGDGDTGPNTGGMGAYSPAPVLTPALEQKVMERIILPTVRGMAAEGRPFTGVLFAGLMITPGADGPEPTLIEFNVRFGDPECQTLLLRLKSDLLPVLVAAADGTLDQVTLEWLDQAALCVVMAAAGYPGPVVGGTAIRGLDAAAAVPGVTVFHAGTRADADGTIRAAGGRVLGVAARAATVAEAQRNAYRAVDALDWPEGFCRRDIGWRAITRDPSRP